LCIISTHLYWGAVSVFATWLLVVSTCRRDQLLTSKILANFGKTRTLKLLLYAFFWVIPRRLKFICWRFGTLCLFHLHKHVGAPTCLWRWNKQSVPKRRHIDFRCRGIAQKKAYNIQYTAKVWNQEPWNYLLYNNGNNKNYIFEETRSRTHKIINCSFKKPNNIPNNAVPCLVPRASSPSSGIS